MTDYMKRTLSMLELAIKQFKVADKDKMESEELDYQEAVAEVREASLNLYYKALKLVEDSLFTLQGNNGISEEMLDDCVDRLRKYIDANEILFEIN